VNAVADDMSRTEPFQRREPMARHTSWRVGGPAELFCKPESIEQLQAFLAAVPNDLPIYWIGLGSNLLVRDGGIRGAVIATGHLPKQLERIDAERVTAGAGLPCMLLARQCARWQLGPAAFFAGIPGTVGGALAMNAGAYGSETWDRVESVETIARDGSRRTRRRDEFALGYRSVEGLGEEWFVAATFRFERDESIGMNTIKTMLERRAESQPLGLPSCGSVFRNPPGAFAGQLIEAAGLKGYSVGGAVVSHKHANFIINTGSATAADIEELIEVVRRRVAQQSGIELQLEAKVLGERQRGWS